MNAGLIGLLSLGVSMIAATVSIWNVQRNRVLALNTGSLQVVAAIFQEYRSAEFRAHLARTFEYASAYTSAEGGLESVPESNRDSLYAVCYFFDYLGVMVAFGLVHRDVIVGPLCTQIIRVWDMLEPLIVRERAHRLRDYPPDASPGFLKYFQFLEQLVRQSGGRNASVLVNRRLKYARLFD